MGKKKKEEEEKKKEEEEEDEKRNKEDDDKEEEVMAELVAKILSILKKKEMRRKKKREQEKKEEDDEEEDEAKRKKEDDEGNFLEYAITGGTTFSNGSALHVAIRTGAPVQFIKNLVGLMSKSDLETRDMFEQTALHCAAVVGYTEAARILVDKNPSLTKLREQSKDTALHAAAQYAHKKTVLFLLPVTRREDPSAFAGESGALLLNCLIIAEFYDIAMYLLRCYPDLAIQKDKWGDTGLDELANKPNSFFSGNQLSFLQRLLYKCIYVEKVKVHHREDVKNPAAEPEYPPHEPKQRKFKFLQHVRDTKLKHVQALQLTKILCADIVKIKALKKGNLWEDPILLAARMGIHELVWETVKAFPDAIWCWDENKWTIFHQAVVYRKERFTI